MKLNTKKVIEIKELLAAGKKQPAIAKQFGVSRSIISDIATGRAWAHTGSLLPSKKIGGQSKPLLVDDRILTLEAEILHLKDERNIIQKQLKAVTKTHGLFTAMVEEMERIVVPMQPLQMLPVERKPEIGDKIEEHLVMHISDGHHDQIVEPSECGGLERYNFPISMRRAEHYVDTVLKWTQQTLAPQFNFPTLTILAYGDHTSGEIHSGTQRSYFRNMFKNSFAIGQLHSLMYRDLSPYFETVNVVYVPGNHGRRSIKKDHHGAHDNWDYMVAEIARLHCRDIPNINFVIPNAFSINLDIGGVGFNIVHGDGVQSSMGIPWYGLERRQRRIMALNQVTGTHIKYFCCGHFHRSTTLTDVDGELLVNGSWVASDAFIYNSFSGYSEPTQLLHGTNFQHGVTWRLPIRLKTVDEYKGPQRYQIDLMREVGI